MTEQQRHTRRHPRRRSRESVLYHSVLKEADPRLIAAAARAEGLTDELVVARVLLARYLAEHPENVEVMVKAMHLLARMVIAQHRLSGEDAAALEGHLSKLADEMAVAILGKEPNGG
jgi:hypothetical protein